jgi:3-phosphoglycerate kinase
MNKLTIDDVDLQGKLVLMRVDFNVAREKGETIDSQSARWIASDALREFTSEAVQNKLKARR